MKKVWINGQIIEMTDEEYEKRVAARKARRGEKPAKSKNTKKEK